jgi:hypothetical protein
VRTHDRVLALVGSDTLASGNAGEPITGGAASVLLGIDFLRTPSDPWRVRMDSVTLDHD